MKGIMKSIKRKFASKTKEKEDKPKSGSSGNVQTGSLGAMESKATNGDGSPTAAGGVGGSTSGRETKGAAAGGTGGGGGGEKKAAKKSSKRKSLTGGPAAAGSAAGGGGGSPRTSGNTHRTSVTNSSNTNGSEERPLQRADLLKPIASFNDTPASNKAALFIHKLRLCSIMFEWGLDGEAAQKDNRAKEVKRQQLLELVEYIGKNKNIFTEAVLVEIIKMVSANLFRALPPRQNADSVGKGEGGGGDGEEDDPVFEPSWPHLQIVYEFFLRFIVSSDVDIRTLKKHINGAFVLRILELFDSEDHRERDYLKTILHRIYAKFMSLRAFIRKAINNVFFVFMYETERHNGIAELLEILGSIINGFALPLKAEHKTFLKKVLTPMHKVKTLSTFHQQLSYCVTQFVDKDPQLAVPVLQGLIRFWPVTNSAKEVLFLNELEELLELTQPEEFRTLLVPLFSQLSKSIGSPHFQVAERALFLWHNEYISGLIADHRAQVLPVIFPVLHVNSQHHWNPTVNNLTLNVLKIFMELDSSLVEDCSKNYTEELSRKEARHARKAEIWQKLEDASEEKRRELIAEFGSLALSPSSSSSSSSSSSASSSSSGPSSSSMGGSDI